MILSIAYKKILRWLLTRPSDPSMNIITKKYIRLKA